ncbi:oxidoreductase, FAD/FMN-binding protein [Necator americanus]|uniref:Oxidoreductase, FAD/FMN-binding protein n=1 Tax=Necator americanus TaxID=51031 RepID=W2TBG6_NECAM|nr:oxidoreductase, FAD/FMN-binding protein [Necator americanus]ETN78939.1 oxidoreductase, FAD/FMN-binding protein [Necator americanus]
MVHERIPAEAADVSILGTPLTFPNYRKAKNRFLKAALTERMSTWDPEDLSKRGIPTQELINVFDKWGEGGFGVILTGNVIVEPRNLEGAGNPIICRENDSPEMRKAFSELAKVSKRDGALVLVQLSHAGRQTPIGVNEYPYSSSDVKLNSTFVKSGKPIPLALDQIKTEVIDRFVYAAKLAYETGFDGVQLHAAHGYLLSQFLSPSANKRKDRYGGSLENRVRIIIEIFDAIRKEIPAATGFIVGIKINSVEFQSEGLTVEDSREACSIIEIRPVFKEAVVYLTGGFRTAAGMVRAIKSGATDGIGLGRPITAEPDLPLKILKQHCLSAPDTKINPDDFMMTFLVSTAQMGEMAKLPASFLKNVCEGIADLSIPAEAENFEKCVEPYVLEVLKLTEEKKPVHGVFQYKKLFDYEMIPAPKFLNVHERIPAERADPSVLGREIVFSNGRKAKNCFLKSAMSDGLSTWDPEDLSKRGIPTQELINVYDKWGHGGFGVIVVGNIMVDPRNLERAGNAIICRENDSPTLRQAYSRLSAAAKTDGALVIAQLSHAGRQTPIAINEHPYSCSEVQSNSFVKCAKPIPFALDQIKTEVIDRFVYAAKFAHDTGLLIDWFDGVELHAAHGHLLSQFISPITNKRTDKYGGPLKNRVGIIGEIIRAIRKETPNNFIVGIKKNSVDFQPNGVNNDEVKVACSILEVRPAFKKTAVYVTGGFRTVAAMVKAVNSGATNGIGLARPATAEPDLPLKILAGCCLSAADTKVNPEDFTMTFLVSTAQMGQMGKLPTSKLTNVCEGIADLSIPDEAHNFKKLAADYLLDIAKLNNTNKPVIGNLQYRNLF